MRNNIQHLRTYHWNMDKVSKLAEQQRELQVGNKKIFGGMAHRVFDGSKSRNRSGSIYLGSREAAQNSEDNRRDSQNHNITGIVNCSPDIPCEHENMEYCVVPVRDDSREEILPFLEGAANFIDSRLGKENNGNACNVLVHCRQGVSRSVTVVLAYLIKYQGMSREEALVSVKSQRPQAKPNVGFWKQLQDFERMVGINQDESNSERRDEKMDSENERRVEITCGIGKQPKWLSAIFQGMDEREKPDNEDNPEDWAQRSNAIFCTMGTNAHNKLIAEELVFDEIKEIGKDDTQKILCEAIAYVWSRGLIEFDMKWLRALFNFLVTRESIGYSAIEINEIVIAMFQEDSEFTKLCTGKIYPDQKDKIIQLLPTNSNIS